MSTPPDTLAIQRRIDTERAAFLALRQKLARDLRPFKAPLEMPDNLIAYAEEFGPDNAVAKLGADPQHFGVDVPVAARKELAPLVLSLVDSSYKLDGLVAERENILAKADPRRKRVYISYGREFTFDVAKGTITYLDAPDKTEKLHLEVVHTKDQPALSKVPGLSKDKKQSRSM